MSTKDYLEKDYYKALGVAKDADAGTIKKAYRKLAQQLHPDKNPGDAKAEARFKEVSEAYDVLSDPAKRKEYDETQAMFAGGGFRPGAGGGFGGGGGMPFDVSNLCGGGANLGDLFDGLFSGGRSGRRAGPARGSDLQAELRLDFADAVRGATLPLTVTAPGTCRTCGGSGAKPGTSPRTCPRCNGSGHVSTNQGGFGFSEPCRDCRGTGRLIDDPCPECRGAGVTNQTRTITVRVPAGVRDGATLRLAGKGAPGERGAPAGDLLVTVRVAPHPLFGRTGNDLTLTVPVSFAEATLGATVRVPTLDGAVSVKVPAGTPSGRTLRVRGRGVPAAKNPGDLLVTVEVAVPQRLSNDAKAALEAFAAVSPDDPRPHITAAVSHG
ncbi:MAG: molecular chaperone DnaJ [Jatrophihabitans sp.]|uniref:molecular chaperone DnaJ n=1 Tax=Jatrophihabitans sp. TaxID=1932789 RepID=UPI003F7F00D9